ncbi:MAG TPA: NAD(P)H-dependent oxidoreductase subunit E [Planctomycetota bacterium]|nr:NAD(P)H-dependent oxidoreductase subunit E [Planctomycetota bacterium]HRR81615.1 NAD(P)H-dependent oxidoreductase subunit E [Planctomycetota bacterium]HRT93088.1 NAD(P)H-dependent oxidoreductase subunit E [Planctomycetota bacterium]
MSALDLTFVDQVVAGIGRGPEKVIPILQAIQAHYRYLPEEALRRVCETTEITPAALMGVSTFYSQFRHRPMGQHLVRVCVGTACHVKGAGLVHDAFVRHLRVPEGDDTDPDRLFTLQKVACLGCCTLAPVVQIDEVTYGHLTPDRVPAVLRDFLELDRTGEQKHWADRPAEHEGDGAEIRIGLGSCCIARGSGKVEHALQAALAHSGVRARIKRVGCVGMCHQTPLVEIVRPGKPTALYAQVKAEDVEAIVLRHFRPRSLGRRLKVAAANLLDRLYTDAAWTPVTRYALDVRDPHVAAFLGPQKHLAVEHCGEIDPTDLDEYLAHDGFVALRRCLGVAQEVGECGVRSVECGGNSGIRNSESQTPDAIIEEIRRSGLRGRGGAGFLTGVKWDLVRKAKGEKKHIVCNGDEGDPGAFMDRMLLESYPYRVLEGMIIAAFAVGADEGYLYIREEYPLAVRRVREALRVLAERGLLGENILGSGFSLRLQIMEGAGAFVCGEETALLASIEGKRGMPRLRPPYPAEKGLWGKPTLINNVETYSLVPWILRHGAEAFAAIGTATSKGTKVFALAGKVARGGLVEVPMGISIREVVEQVGGGVGQAPPCAGLPAAAPREVRRFKAVQIGGPSGGCLPASLSDVPVDFEALTAAGAIMGSGGLVVLDDLDCMVDIAHYFLEFTQNQSCGRCTFCRIGTRRMLDILERLRTGEGRKGDIEELEHLAAMVKKGSLCGLGKTAPNPVLTTIRYFRDEYEAHIAGRCPAGRCKALIQYVVTDDCIGCTLCAQHCPVDAIPMTPYEKHAIDATKCIRCGTCKALCPVAAIKVE